MNKIQFMLTKYRKLPIEIKASTWYTICTILQRAISFFTLPIFTRMLSTSEYGKVSIYQSWLGVIIIFTTLNLQYGSFNTAMIKYENQKDEYIASLEGICTVLTLSTMILFLIFPEFWSGVFDLPFVLLIVMLFEIISIASINFWSGKNRFEYKYRKMIALTLALAVLSPLVSIVFILKSNGDKGVAKILGNSVVYILLGIIIFIYNVYKGKKIINKSFWKYALKFNIPLIPYYLSQIIFNQSDRIMISKLVGIDKSGIYSVAFSFAIVLSFIINAINSSYVPWVYRCIKNNNIKKISPITNILVILITFMLFFLVLFAPEIIYLFAGERYIEAIWIIPPVAVSQLFLFLSQICINIMFYYEDNMSLVKGSILSAVLNLILNYIFINRFGYLAAGYTTLICYIVFFICNYYYMKKNWSINMCGRKIPYNFNAILSIVCLFLTIIFIILMFYENLIIRSSILLVFIIIIIIKRNYVFYWIKYMRNLLKKF